VISLDPSFLMPIAEHNGAKLVNVADWSNECGPTPVESVTWGSVKAIHH
jgi:hypothetical protein